MHDTVKNATVQEHFIILGMQCRNVQCKNNNFYYAQHSAEI